MMQLRYDLEPGWELRIMRGHFGINGNQLSVTLHGPKERGKGRELRGMASASVESTDTVECVAQRLVTRVLREAGQGG